MGNKFCKFCGGKVEEYHSICHHCGRQINLVTEIKETNNDNVDNSKEFYKSDWFMWLTLIFFAPVGIFLMFKFNEKLTKQTKIIISVLFGLFFIGTYGSMGSDANDYNNSTNVESSLSSEKIESKIKVVMVDFTAMSLDEIKAWCSDNKIKYEIKESYSNDIPKNNFINQSTPANEEVNQGDKIVITYSLGAEPTISQKNAVKKAESYIDYSAFSRTGLIKQLEFEGFSKEDATYGVDNITVDWNEQAALKAESYLEYQAFSKSGLISQLKFEGFTNEQAAYGVSQVGL